MNSPVDQYFRKFKKLRLSLTSRCNFACTYCVDEIIETGFKNPVKKDFSDTIQKKISAKQIIQQVKALHQICEFDNIRLTGGEPLLYNELFYVISALKSEGIHDLRLTTNGFLLNPYAEKLAKAGIKKINVSLDAVDADAFYKITRKDNLKEVLNGIDAALGVGIDVKLNAVILKNVNENQIIPLLQFAMERNIPLRYLEIMGMGHLYRSFEKSLVTESEMLGIIASRFQFTEMERTKAATANYWNVNNTGYKFGIIANVSRPFCSDCDRLRLDSTGRLFGCISHKNGLDITSAVNDPEKLWDLLNKALKHKQTHKFEGSELTMKSLGG